MMIERAGGRKFVAALLLTIVAGVTVAVKGDVPTNMLNFLEFLFGALVVGNGVEKVSRTIRTSKEQPAPAPTKDDSELQRQLAELHNNDLLIAQNVATVQDTLGVIIRKTKLDQIP